VSNSEISPASETALKKNCERVIVRENIGLDFAMWQRGLAEYDWSQFDELLLTNSSIIGPLQPLAPLWARPEIAECDFWGLTDNNELQQHLQSYFLVFRQRVLHSARFRDFWRAVLPYKNKSLVIFSYELGLSNWLEEGGFVSRALFAQKEIIAMYRRRRGIWRKYHDYYLYLTLRGRSRNVSVIFPHYLLERGMPFLKIALLRESPSFMKPPEAFAVIEKSLLPADAIAELRQEFPLVNGRLK
jgi:lipopolysaccharide biosynthesis protein